MQVMSHIYYSLEATDLILPADMKKRKERGWALKNIPAALDKREDPFDACFIMSNEKKQKTTRDLITSVQDFCRGLHDVSDDYTAYPYNRPTYKITMSRNAMVHIFDTDLGGVNFSNTLNLRATNNGIFHFVYNHANEMIYTTNIRKILGYDFKYIHLIDGVFDSENFDYTRYNQESEINPHIPLYVYKYDNREVYVKKIPSNTIVVNDKMCEIHPQVTGHIPAHMSLLFNNKTEPVKRAYGKEYWYGKHYRSRNR